jgi:uncharacterized caspase-like protein
MQTYCKVEAANTFSIVSDFNQPNINPYESFMNIYSRIKAKFIERQDSIFFFFSGHGVAKQQEFSVHIIAKNLILNLTLEKVKLFKYLNL